MDAVSELYRAQLTNNPAAFNPIITFRNQADSSARTDALEVGTLFYEYQTLDPYAVENNKLVFGSGPDSLLYSVPDGNGGFKNPFFSNTIFMASPIAEYCTLSGNTLQIRWGRNRYSNLSNTLQYIQIDAGDGTGSHTLYPGQNFNASYFTSGHKVWQIKGFLNNGTFYSCFAYLYITVSNGPTVWGRRPDDNYTPDNGFSSNWIVADVPYPDEGTNTYKWGCLKMSFFYKDITRNLPENQRKITKPVIISEGFDPMFKLAGSTKAFVQNRLIYGNSVSLVSDLNELGYDVIVCEYMPLPNSLRATFNPNGYVLKDANVPTASDYIQRNAFAFVKALQTVKAEMLSAGSIEEIVVIGVSMGGLITRYALRWMEVNNLPHYCRLWVSFDSPQLGVATSLGSQALLAYVANYMETPSSKEKKELILDNPAARQMLINYYTELSNQSPIFGN